MFYNVIIQKNKPKMKTYTSKKMNMATTIVRTTLKANIAIPIPINQNRIFPPKIKPPNMAKMAIAPNLYFVFIRLTT